MKSGIIELYTYWGKLLDDRRYDDVSHRNRFIGMWKRMYGEAFKRYYIQIRPDEGDLATKKDGSNASKKDARNEEIINLKGKMSNAQIGKRYRLTPNHIHKIHLNGKPY